MIYLVFVPALSAAFNAPFPMINKMCFSQKKMKTIWSFSFKSSVLHNYVLMILDHCVVNDNLLMMFKIGNRCCFTYLNRKKKRKEIELVKRTNCWTAWFFCDVVTDNSNMYEFSLIKQMEKIQWTMEREGLKILVKGK